VRSFLAQHKEVLLSTLIIPSRSVFWTILAVEPTACVLQGVAHGRSNKSERENYRTHVQ